MPRISPLIFQRSPRRGSDGIGTLQGGVESPIESGECDSPHPGLPRFHRAGPSTSLDKSIVQNGYSVAGRIAQLPAAVKRVLLLISGRSSRKTHALPPISSFIVASIVAPLGQVLPGSEIKGTMIPQQVSEQWGVPLDVLYREPKRCLTASNGKHCIPPSRTHGENGSQWPLEVLFAPKNR